MTSKLAVRCGSMFLLLAALLLAGGGCTEINAINTRADMSPELMGIASTPDQRYNAWARATNTDMRQIHDDWDRIWLIDKPLMLSPYPVPDR